MNRVFAVALLAGLHCVGFSADNVVLDNIRTFKTNLGILPSYAGISTDKVTIAIIDNGFLGLESADQQYLDNHLVLGEPASGPAQSALPVASSGATPEQVKASDAHSILVYSFDEQWLKTIEGDSGAKQGQFLNTEHGRIMAVTARSLSDAKLILLNGSNITSLGRSVQFAIEAGADIIVHSKVFNGYGVGDSVGPLMQYTEKAARAGILWFNAAGNYGGHVYKARVDHALDRFIKLHSNWRSNISITLNWNQWRDSLESTKPDLDLDLELFEEDPLRAGNFIRIAKSDYFQGDLPSGQQIDQKKQRQTPNENIPNTNDNKTQMVLDKDRDYYIRIVQKEGTHTRILPQDVLVVTVTPQGVKQELTTGKQVNPVVLVDASFSGPSTGEILPPADSEYVITVGAQHPGSSFSGNKPDLMLNNYLAQFTDGTLSDGSSQANAYMGAGIAPYLVAAARAVGHKLTKEDLLEFVRTQRLRAEALRIARGEWTPASLPNGSVELQRGLFDTAPNLRCLIDYVGDHASGLRIWKVPQYVLTSIGLSQSPRYVLTIADNPAKIGIFSGKFPEGTKDSADDAYEYYLHLSLRQIGVDICNRPIIEQCIDNKIRARFRVAGGSFEPYPWDAVGARPIEFVEVRRDPTVIEQAQGRDLPMFKTPTLDEFYTTIGIPARKAVLYRQ